MAAKERERDFLNDIMYAIPPGESRNNWREFLFLMRKVILRNRNALKEIFETRPVHIETFQSFLISHGFNGIGVPKKPLTRLMDSLLSSESESSDMEDSNQDLDEISSDATMLINPATPPGQPKPKIRAPKKEPTYKNENPEPLRKVHSIQDEEPIPLAQEPDYQAERPIALSKNKRTDNYETEVPIRLGKPKKQSYLDEEPIPVARQKAHSFQNEQPIRLSKKKNKTYHDEKPVRIGPPPKPLKRLGKQQRNLTVKPTEKVKVKTGETTQELEVEGKGVHWNKRTNVQGKRVKQRGAPLEYRNRQPKLYTKRPTTRRPNPSQEERLQCPKCDKTFGSKGTLRRHDFEMHPLVPLVFVCSFAGCNASFRRERDLTDHYNAHLDDPNLFQCTWCRMNFRLRQKRDAHMKDQCPNKPDDSDDSDD